MTARTSQQLVPDRCTTGTEAGSRGKVKSEKSSADHYVQRVGPYPTPQQYMLNKRAKYAGAAAPLSTEVYCNNSSILDSVVFHGQCPKYSWFY